MSDLVASRPVGDALVSIISDGTGFWAPKLQAPEAEWRRAMPEANADGEVDLAFLVAHVRLGNASILIDLGFDDPSPASQWQPPRFQRTAGVEAGLAALGVQPSDVTHVLITHPHGDHVAGGTVERDGRRLARFPHARHYINRLDWEGNPARDQPGSLPALHLGVLERLGRLELIDSDREIVPGVALLHAPGESPGHSIVRVRSRGETFYFLGDLFHHPCEVEHPDWVSPGRDRAAALASRRRLLADAARENATLAFSHGRFPAWGRVAPSDGGYRWEWLLSARPPGSQPAS